VVSGLLGLSRNLGLITGAAVMGAVFATAAAGNDILQALPYVIATGMRVTFTVAAALVALALAISVLSHSLSPRQTDPC
jgi:hypothetical protein